MTPHDEQQFRDLISDFVTGSGFAPPFHVVVVASNGSVGVSRYTGADDVEQVCSRIVQPGYLAPLVVTLVTADGRGKSAVIKIEAAPHVLQ